MKKFFISLTLTIIFSYLVIGIPVVFAQDITTPGATTNGTVGTTTNGTTGTTTNGTTGTTTNGTTGTTTNGTTGTTTNTTISDTTVPASTVKNNGTDWGVIVIYGVAGAILGSLITYGAMHDGVRRTV